MVEGEEGTESLVKRPQPHGTLAHRIGYGLHLHRDATRDGQDIQLLCDGGDGASAEEDGDDRHKQRGLKNGDIDLAFRKDLIGVICHGDGEGNTAPEPGEPHQELVSKRDLR